MTVAVQLWLVFFVALLSYQRPGHDLARVVWAICQRRGGGRGREQGAEGGGEGAGRALLVSTQVAGQLRPTDTPITARPHISGRAHLTPPSTEGVIQRYNKISVRDTHFIWSCLIRLTSTIGDGWLSNQWRKVIVSENPDVSSIWKLGSPDGTAVTPGALLHWSRPNLTYGIDLYCHQCIRRRMDNILPS